MAGAGMAFLGQRELRVSAPWFAGGTVQVAIEVLGLQETRKPDCGIDAGRHFIPRRLL